MIDSKHHLILAGAVVLIFAISANIAWLNPWPEKESFRGIDSIPVMWQYNRAAGVEILSAAYFPQTYEMYTDRINRPTYPATVYVIGRVIGFVASPVVELSPLERAGAGYVVLKLLVFFAGAVAMFHILRRWMPSQPAMFATLLMLFHAHSVEFVATFQTTELQVLTPILVIWMFLKVVDQSRDETVSRVRTLVTVSVASFAVGILMLAKQNYAVYLAIVLFALYKRRWREVILSVVVHLVPLALYLLYLRAMDIPYVNHEAANYDQGVWMLDMFRQNPILSVQQVMHSLWQSLRHLVGFFSVWLLFAMGAVARPRDFKLTRDRLIFIALLFFGTWAQIFAANRYYDYMVSDVAIVIFGLGAWALWMWISHIAHSFTTSPELVRRRLTTGVLTVWFLGNVLSFVNFPWVHPFDQPARRSEVLNNRQEMVENPEEFTDEQREQARGGVIIDREQED
ncbi:MAG: hypothetical protein ACOCYB_11565 [Alkalispirochaeta sp.]